MEGKNADFLLAPQTRLFSKTKAKIKSLARDFTFNIDCASPDTFFSRGKRCWGDEIRFDSLPTSPLLSLGHHNRQQEMPIKSRTARSAQGSSKASPFSSQGRASVAGASAMFDLPDPRGGSVTNEGIRRSLREKRPNRKYDSLDEDERHKMSSKSTKEGGRYHLRIPQHQVSNFLRNI